MDELRQGARGSFRSSTGEAGQSRKHSTDFGGRSLTTEPLGAALRILRQGEVCPPPGVPARRMAGRPHQHEGMEPAFWRAPPLAPKVDNAKEPGAGREVTKSRPTSSSATR